MPQRLDIDLNRLEIFKEVVLSGSFSKAASQLRQPKSRISRNISALEQELGVQLIYRTTRQFQLTQAGNELFHRAFPLLNELKNTLDQVASGSDEVAGSVKITVPEDVGSELMGHLCHEFMLMYPKVHIDLHASNEYVDLVKDSFDIAIRIGRSRDSSMIQKKLGLVGMSFVMSPEFRKQQVSQVKISDLESLPYLAFRPSDPRQHTLKVSNGREVRTVKVKPAFSSNNFFVLRSMAAHGAGITLLPNFLAREAIDDGTLVPVLKEWAPEGVPLQILLPHQRETPVRIRKFIDFLATRLPAKM